MHTPLAAFSTSASTTSSSPKQYAMKKIVVMVCSMAWSSAGLMCGLTSTLIVGISDESSLEDARIGSLVPLAARASPATDSVSGGWPSALLPVGKRSLVSALLYV